MGARGRAPSGAGSAEGTAGGGAAAAGPARYLTLHVATRAEPYYFRAEQPQECAAWVAGLRLVAERNAGQPDLGLDSVKDLEVLGLRDLALGNRLDLLTKYVQSSAGPPLSQFLDASNRIVEGVASYVTTRKASHDGLGDER